MTRFAKRVGFTILLASTAPGLAGAESTIYGAWARDAVKAAAAMSPAPAAVAAQGKAGIGAIIAMRVVMPMMIGCGLDAGK